MLYGLMLTNDRLKRKQVEYFGGSGKTKPIKEKKPRKLASLVSVSNVLLVLFFNLLSDSCANNIDKMNRLGQACSSFSRALISSIVYHLMCLPLTKEPCSFN